jgi:hypothetical protein
MLPLSASAPRGGPPPLQLAALSLKGHHDSSGLASFAGDDRYSVDYLVEEVLDQQPAVVRIWNLSQCAVPATSQMRSSSWSGWRALLLRLPPVDQRRADRTVQPHLGRDITGIARMSAAIRDRPEQAALRAAILISRVLGRQGCNLLRSGFR